MFKTKLKIYNLPWTVFFVEEVDFEGMKQDERFDTVLCGKCDKINLNIYINSTLPEDLMKRAIIHELTHAFLFTYIPNENFTEEQLCNFVESYSEDIIDKALKISLQYNDYKNSK